MEEYKEIEARGGRRPFTFDRVVRLIITLGMVVAAMWLINRLSGVLLPFLVAWLMAYLLEPFVQRNQIGRAHV